MRKLGIVAGALVLAGLAGACGGAPTAPAAVAGGAAFDGGLTLGSGHRSGADSTSTEATANTTPDSPETGLGGLMLGSGH